MEYKVKDRTFKFGKDYYQVTWFGEGVAIIRMRVKRFDPADWDYDIGFTEIEHIIPNELPLSNLNLENDWRPDDVDRMDDFILDIDIPDHREKLIKSIFLTRSEFEILQGD